MNKLTLSELTFLLSVLKQLQLVHKDSLIANDIIQKLSSLLPSEPELVDVEVVK